MNDRDLKRNGRVFKMIKWRPFAGSQHFKPEGLSEAGDIFRECNDGWFQNMRLETGCRTNILAIEGYEEWYEEIHNYWLDQLRVGNYITFNIAEDQERPYPYVFKGRESIPNSVEKMILYSVGVARTEPFMGCLPAYVVGVPIQLEILEYYFLPMDDWFVKNGFGIRIAQGGRFEVKCENNTEIIDYIHEMQNLYEDWVGEKLPLEDLNLNNWEIKNKALTKPR